MATLLRFNEGLKDFLLFAEEDGIKQVQRLAVDIQLDGKHVGYIARDGKVTIVTNAIGKPSHIIEVSFTETQWTAIALRAKEFRERCARIAQEQAQAQAEQDRILDQAYEQMEALGASSPA
ncbi:hypothetical protein A2524_04435 [Candidatus Wolfebacteria bacterium RIFOXYD12_FULL_48_21]|uniref:Uncharacterized protein n=1 Tax=Candidatus Wolfebacteria bacterium RIFOXYD1_FULL_48_65 TaxID=1802561 RepID=A0A1F8E3B2_9BACT|nr:MAG: hypothetical protein A2610_03515 [Candidatus Wolfebacteria bacterium RIFOXYD1_FULL_48_65]OGM95292.1 MAG: hypothetical protein A2524_04435 [Candidatus Wolfebacteria bacterium RIFOXYD12_FULL_48_21]OGM96861.1 MAG: hypothetical protein A2532_01795 [Candidatus Wolfebacteria bacterium RIFOXYD2_FULL_48_11]